MQKNQKNSILLPATCNNKLRGDMGFSNRLVDALRQGARRWSCGFGHLLPFTSQMTDGGRAASSPQLYA